MTKQSKRPRLFLETILWSTFVVSVCVGIGSFAGLATRFVKNTSELFCNSRKILILLRD